MTVHLNRKAQTWSYRFNRGKRRFSKGGFRTKQQAEDSETRLLDRIIRGEVLPESVGDDMLLTEATKLYYELYSIKRKRSHDMDSYRIPVLDRFFEKRKLADITPEDVQCLRDSLQAKNLSDATVNAYHVLLKSIINWLKKNRKFRGDNPACFVKLEKVEKARVRFLYPAEERILTPAVQKHPEIWPYYFVALHTGMRLSEIVNLRIKDVSVLTRLIFVAHAKSKASRYVPMSEELAKFLEGLVEGREPEDLVISSRSRFHVSHQFSLIARTVGLQDFTFHCLRHTFAGHLLSRGVPIYKVSKILGHCSVVVTETHYGHMAIQELKSAVDQVDGIVKLHPNYILQTAQNGNVTQTR